MRQTIWLLTGLIAATLLMSGCEPSYKKAAISALDTSWFSEIQIEENRTTITFLSDSVFKRNSTDIDESVHSTLDQILVLAESLDQPNIEISVHTDNKLPEEVAQRLSTERAIALLNYYRTRAIDGEVVIESYGYGSIRPRADNTALQGRLLNRRIEVVLTPDSN